MGRYSLVLLVVLTLSFSSIAFSQEAFAVEVCHVEGNGEQNTLDISQSAVNSHLRNHEDDYVGACVDSDITAPAAAITYSSEGPYKQGTTITLTATFDEELKDSPVPQIAISGSNSLSASDMTKISSTVYTYDFTVGSGDGIATVTLATAQDLAGNVVTSTPTSGGTFTVDNTAPSVSADNIDTPTDDTTPNLTITAESGSTIAVTSDGTSGNVGTATATGSSQIITLSTLDEGTQTLTVTATDAAGNSGTDTISVTVDTTAPVITLSGDNPQTV
ncbi:MAG: Ig-like domain-containing protein, partial [Nitrosopumilus sp.]